MSSHADELDFDLFEGIDDKTLAGANFTADVISELRRAFGSLHDASGLTQKEISDRLDASKSAVHRWLYGDGNMTLKKLGELIWAMDCRAAFKITTDLSEQGDAIESAKEAATACTVVAGVPTTSALERWYKLEALRPDDLTHLHISSMNGPHLSMVGTINNEIVHGRILSVGQDQAVANFKCAPVARPIEGVAVREIRSEASCTTVLESKQSRAESILITYSASVDRQSIASVA